MLIKRITNISISGLRWIKHTTTTTYCLSVPEKDLYQRKQQQQLLKNNSTLNSTQPEITDAGVWHLYVRIINNITIL